MDQSKLVLGALALFTLSATVAARPMADRVNDLLVQRLLAGVTGQAGADSLRGTKDLWVDVVVQDGVAKAPGMASLATDLRQSDLEGRLRDGGFRVMDPTRRSLALGLRPTLALTVLYSPAGSGPDDKAFYLVLASATQQCTPLGGAEQTLVTWADAGTAIPALGNAHDVDAVRAAAQARVTDFIAAAKRP
jgi:hypothetical protein